MASTTPNEEPAAEEFYAGEEGQVEQVDQSQGPEQADDSAAMPEVPEQLDGTAAQQEDAPPEPPAAEIAAPDSSR